MKNIDVLHAFLTAVDPTVPSYYSFYFLHAINEVPSRVGDVITEAAASYAPNAGMLWGAKAERATVYRAVDTANYAYVSFVLDHFIQFSDENPAQGIPFNADTATRREELVKAATRYLSQINVEDKAKLAAVQTYISAVSGLLFPLRTEIESTDKETFGKSFNKTLDPVLAQETFRGLDLFKSSLERDDIHVAMVPSLVSVQSVMDRLGYGRTKIALIKDVLSKAVSPFFPDFKGPSQLGVNIALNRVLNDIPQKINPKSEQVILRVSAINRHGAAFQDDEAVKSTVSFITTLACAKNREMVYAFLQAMWRVYGTKARPPSLAMIKWMDHVGQILMEDTSTGSTNAAQHKYHPQVNALIFAAHLSEAMEYFFSPSKCSATIAYHLHNLSLAEKIDYMYRVISLDHDINNNKTKDWFTDLMQTQLGNVSTSCHAIAIRYEQFERSFFDMCSAHLGARKSGLISFCHRTLPEVARYYAVSELYAAFNENSLANPNFPWYSTILVLRAPESFVDEWVEPPIEHKSVADLLVISHPKTRTTDEVVSESIDHKAPRFAAEDGVESWVVRTVMPASDEEREQIKAMINTATADINKTIMANRAARKNIVDNLEKALSTALVGIDDETTRRSLITEAMSRIIK